MEGKNKVARIIAYLCIIIAVCVVVFSFLSRCFKKDYNEVFFAVWKIELPENMKEQFRKTEDTWYGDGMRYAVFKLKEEPTEFIEDFEIEKNEAVERVVSKYLSNAPFHISKKYLPNWDSQYYFKHIEKEAQENGIRHCYMIYFPDILRLAICQYFVPISNLSYTYTACYSLNYVYGGYIPMVS